MKYYAEAQLTWGLVKTGEHTYSLQGDHGCELQFLPAEPEGGRGGGGGEGGREGGGRGGGGG